MAAPKGMRADDVVKTPPAPGNGYIGAIAVSQPTFDWKSEQDRFMALAHQRADRAARRAFKAWHSRKREDAIAECVGKVWATWVYNLERGKDPVALLGPN